MNDTGVIISSAAAILVIVFLILKLKIDPVVSLVVGSIGLALVNGLAPGDAVTTVLTGFGDILAEVGLLIAFGVLSGAILNYLGAIHKLSALLLRIFGRKLMPYAFGLTTGTLLASIFVDVCLVMTAPLAKNVASSIGRHGIARMASSIMIGVEVALTMTIPGVVAVALSGLLKVPVGIFMLAALPVAVLTIISSIAIMTFLFRLGFWKPDVDETELARKAQEAEQRARVLEGTEHLDEGNATEDDARAHLIPSTGASVTGAEVADSDIGGRTSVTRSGHGVGPAGDSVVEDGSPADPHPTNDTSTDESSANDTSTTSGPTGIIAEAHQPHLLTSLSPLLFAFVLIGGGAILGIAGVESPVLDLLSDPTVALMFAFLGLTVIARRHGGLANTTDVMKRGFEESGQILILTGVGGCLAAVIAKIGVGEILLDSLSPNSAFPLLIVWVIAALLHLAVGSVTTSAITAAGILAPIASQLGVSPVLVALAAASGSMFVIHFTSNTFWMLQSLYGLTIKGGLKACTVAVSVASIMGLVWTLALSVFI